MNSTASLPQHHHVDLGRFEQLNVDLSMFPAVARVFVNILPAWRDEMQRAMVWSDVHALRESLHKMKGCCGMMGAERLALEIAQVEQSLVLHGLDRSTPQLLDVLRKVGEMEDEVKILGAVT